MTRIEVEQLVKRYPQARTNAVDGISFSVRSGETFGLLGPNGAGKTRRSRPRAQPADPAASVTGVSTRRLGSCPAWPRWIVTTVDSKTREKTRLSIACMPREDAGALLSGAAQAVIREQAELLDLRLARPSLEDVFIHLTGSNLRS